MVKEGRHPLLWFPLKFREGGPTQAKLNVGPGDEARYIPSMPPERMGVGDAVLQEERSSIQALFWPHQYEWSVADITIQ